MLRIHEGKLFAQGFRFALVASRFNRLFSQALVEGALDCLTRHGAGEKDVEVFWVPGSFELPQMVRHLALQKETWDAIICLGVLIRGDTPHFDVLASQVPRSLSQVALDASIPITFGLLTCDTQDQALSRSGAKEGNKGWEAALSAIEMVNLFKELHG